MTPTRSAFAPKTVTAVSTSSAQGIPRTRRFNWLARHFPDPEQQREYAREKCVEAIASAVDTMIDKAGMSQTAIAEKLGKSKGYVSRVLSGAHNMTLHTLGDLLWATGTEARWDPDTRHLEMVELGVIDVLTDDHEAWSDVVSASQSGEFAPTGGMR